MDSDILKQFHDAVALGKIDVVRTMLENDGALASAADAQGEQAIHALFQNFNAAMLSLLLAHGADINARDADGRTLLHTIRDPEGVAVLVGEGADIDARDLLGRTPLIEQAANYEDSVDGVALALLDLGADPNASDQDGDTAMAFARSASNDDLIQRLRRAGAEDPPAFILGEWRTK
ncbi:ankyrin repeat domain-containing protein [Dyella sp. GSA-30]|uniref:ankyrin repeat domain-containing protein n=1 Tax=Dyella sp. GSA-30 TaxID=2994496 RepID=UPI00249116C6|nr:ankyrin repeat domain-containing protein [Dyella sp. GSA-30]BDU22905.1 hypothetical protein DYGSA30_43620 [Dyella sp. GSA-30]